ncbi:MAG: hypothetical protein ACI8S6_005867 [Myxococcota bacterium]|jgi:hypothetical protein
MARLFAGGLQAAVDQRSGGVPADELRGELLEGGDRGRLELRCCHEVRLQVLSRQRRFDVFQRAAALAEVLEALSRAADRADHCVVRGTFLIRERHLAARS